MLINVYNSTSGNYIMTSRLIQLGSDHNYGKNFVLICWIGQPNECYITLFDKFEIQTTNIVDTISLYEAIACLKHAIKNQNAKEQNIFYNLFILKSANRYLDDMMYKLSYELLYQKCAQKIQKTWLESFYNPTKHICKKRLLKEFQELKRDA